MACIPSVSTLSGTTTSYTYNVDGQQLTAEQGSATVASGTWNGAGQLTTFGSSTANMSCPKTAEILILRRQRGVLEWYRASGIAAAPVGAAPRGDSDGGRACREHEHRAGREPGPGRQTARYATACQRLPLGWQRMTEGGIR
jgi:hypothetical protein